MSFLDLVFYIFIFVVGIQVIFNLFFFGKFAFLKSSNTTSNKIGVSVIICAKNEAENLKIFLPSIVTQNHPNFEIVLINDASRDKTQKVMEQFASKHSNIKFVNVKNVEAFWGNKKYALFTDADCKPVSKHWISQMCSHFNESKTIVLGYGAYTKIEKSLLNKLIRFETLQTAITYLSFAKAGIPYMGVGRNLAYTKSEFYKANGFINHLDIRSGDDDLFINQVANSANTTICFSPESFTQSIPETTFKNWILQKRRHISTAKHYKLKHKLLLAILFCSQLFFWILAFVLLLESFQWKLVIALMIFRFFTQFMVVGYSAKKLGEKDILLLLPFLELFLIIAQLTIFIKNLVSKPNHWK